MAEATHDDALIEAVARVLKMASPKAGRAERDGDLKSQPFSDAVCHDLARAVLPFIAEARRKGMEDMRERAVATAISVTEGQSKGWKRNPSKDGCGGAIAASNTGFFTAASIRALPLEPAKETR